jgi:ARG and Rhodanese-Phosphatase-superfamily-associated Protein domain
MPITRPKVFGTLLATILILGGAAFAAARFNLCARAANAPGGDPQLAQTGWRLAHPVTYENLTIFPVLTAQDADTSQFATLDEALASGEALITEQGAEMRRMRDGAVVPNYQPGPQVNQLVLINRGKRPLILLAGEVVSGGKQDRIIGKDRIVPIGAAPLPLDVFCVEHGRWTPGAVQFSAAETMVHPSVRDKAAVDQNQSEVWAAVRGEADAVGSASQEMPLRSGNYSAGAGATAPPSQNQTVTAESQPATITRSAVAGAIAQSGTQDYQKIYQQSPIGASVESFTEEMQRRFAHETSGLKGERVVGVVVAFGPEVAWSDVFASSQLFDSYWPKLLRSYVVEAMTRPRILRPASLDEARDFLRPATGHIEEETEPGVYRWRKQAEGRLAEIELDALDPKPFPLHWLRVLHGESDVRPRYVD